MLDAKLIFGHSENCQGASAQEKVKIVEEEDDDDDEWSFRLAAAAFAIGSLLLRLN